MYDTVDRVVSRRAAISSGRDSGPVRDSIVVYRLLTIVRLRFVLYEYGYTALADPSDRKAVRAAQCRPRRRHGIP